MPPPSKATNSLQDFSDIISVSDDGRVLFKDSRVGFMMKVGCLDGSFFDESTWTRLQEQLRPLLFLEESEELQFCFRKNCDFESLIEKKFYELGLTKNEFTRKLLLKDLNYLIEQIDFDNPKVLTSSLVLTYSVNAKDKEEKTLEEALESRRLHIERIFRHQGVTAQKLDRDAMMLEIARVSSGVRYTQSSDVLNEWPSVSISPREVRINDQIFRAVVLKQLPENYSEMGMIQALTELPVPFDLCVRFRGQNSAALKKRLKRKKNVLLGFAQQRSSGDPETQMRYQEIEHLLQRLSDSHDTLLDMTLTLGVRSHQSHDVLARKALTEIFGAESRMGHLSFEEASLSTFDCFLETIPGCRGHVFHQQALLASNATHFLPLFSTHEGDDRPVVTYETRSGNLFSIHPFHYQLANYNWLVSGTSGAGKSFFVNSILLKSAALQPRVFIIDIGGSYRKITQFFGGDCIGLDVQQGFKLSPFFIPPSKNAQEESRRREHIQMVFWEMLRDENRLPSVAARGLLHEILNPYFESAQLPPHPISAIRDSLKALSHPEATRMALLLDRWCQPSFFGQFLDHSEPLPDTGRTVMFDLKGLVDFEDLSRVVQLILCSSIWNSVRADSSQFSFIILDEVAFSLLKWQPNFVDELISTVRKYNTGVIVVAQDLEKITSNSAGASILQNTQMKAILQQRGDQRNFGTPLSLTKSELEMIDALDRRKGVFSDIFLMIDDRRAVIRFTPNLLEYFLATSVPQENRYLEKELQRYSGEYHEKMYQFIEDYAA
jgi:hypothetical protein